MTIPFARIPSPSALRLPGAYTEQDNSRALQGSAPRPSTALLLGQMDSAVGTATELTLYLVPSTTEGDTLFARDSMLAAMIRAFKAKNALTTVYAIGADEEAASVAATITSVITGPATAVGTLHMYVHGKYIPIAVADADTATDIGDAIDTELALADHDDIHLGSTNAAGTVTWLCKWKGEAGNQLRVQFNLRDGEEFPAGVSVASLDAVLASGTADTDIDDLLAGLDVGWYNTVAVGFHNDTNHTDLDAHIESEWDPLTKHESHAYAGFCGTVAETTTHGNAQNYEHISIAAPGRTPQPPWIAAALFAAIGALRWENDPNRPFNKQSMKAGGNWAEKLDVPRKGQAFSAIERNTLLFDGVTTIGFIGGAKEPRIDRAITSYQTNASATPDPSYLDTTTMLNLANWQYQLRARIEGRYPDSKLAADGVKPDPGSIIITPSVVRGEILDLYEDLSETGEALVGNLAAFNTDLFVEINSSDPTRLDIVAAPRLIVGAHIFAIKSQFILGTSI
jgi:phage tail sheath gpL-like